MKSSGSGLIVCLPSLSTHEKQAMTDRVDGSSAKKGHQEARVTFLVGCRELNPFTVLVFPAPILENPLPVASLGPTIWKAGQRCG